MLIDWLSPLEYRPTYYWTSTNQAQKCPVCEGRGQVPPNFYRIVEPPDWTYTLSSTLLSPETCRTCGGRGIIYPPIPMWP